MPPSLWPSTARSAGNYGHLDRRTVVAHALPARLSAVRDHAPVELIGWTEVEDRVGCHLITTSPPSPRSWAGRTTTASPRRGRTVTDTTRADPVTVVPGRSGCRITDIEAAPCLADDPRPQRRHDQSLVERHGLQSARDDPSERAGARQVRIVVDGQRVSAAREGHDVELGQGSGSEGDLLVRNRIVCVNHGHRRASRSSIVVVIRDHRPVGLSGWSRETRDVSLRRPRVATGDAPSGHRR